MSTVHRVLPVLMLLLPLQARSGEWRTHESNMISYTQRIEANEKEISELVEKKKNTEDPGALKEIMADIKRKHDELEKISAAS